MFSALMCLVLRSLVRRVDSRQVEFYVRCPELSMLIEDNVLHSLVAGRSKIYASRFVMFQRRRFMQVGYLTGAVASRAEIDVQESCLFM